MNGNVYRGNVSTMWLSSQAGFNPAFREEKVAGNALAFLLSEHKLNNVSSGYIFGQELGRDPDLTLFTQGQVPLECA
ncbi:hypothetical protein K0M31_018535 [Melipona bicolor]|uniref:Uncharacterized protein n=1 Tax=Melipona bicolor TaxID=60889 RepID=A0AA40KRS7_9HYME|nr:hypothetical protein K0M31_018535 [Melipona bicolor]